MHPGITSGHAPMRPDEIPVIVATHQYLAAPYLARIERTREWHADAVRHRLLALHGAGPTLAAVLVARLRLTAGTVLVRAGERLSGVPRRGAAKLEPSATAMDLRNPGVRFPARLPEP